MRGGGGGAEKWLSLHAIRRGSAPGLTALPRWTFYLQINDCRHVMTLGSNRPAPLQPALGWGGAVVLGSGTAWPEPRPLLRRVLAEEEVARTLSQSGCWPEAVAKPWELLVNPRDAQ